VGSNTNFPNQIFPSLYLGLLKGDKCDSSIFRKVVFLFFYFLLSFWGYYYLFGSIVSGLHISPPSIRVSLSVESV
jgi:hypothetical protein